MLILLEKPVATEFLFVMSFEVSASVKVITDQQLCRFYISIWGREKLVRSLFGLSKNI